MANYICVQEAGCTNSPVRLSDARGNTVKNFGGFQFSQAFALAGESQPRETEGVSS